MARLKQLRDKNLPPKRYISKKLVIPGTTAMAPDLTDDQIRAAYRAAYVKYKLRGIEITLPEEMGVFKKLHK